MIAAIRLEIRPQRPLACEKKYGTHHAPAYGTYLSIYYFFFGGGGFKIVIIANFVCFRLLNSNCMRWHVYSLMYYE